jgi:predicted nucleic acid-binding Zn ribbon protein
VCYYKNNQKLQIKGGEGMTSYIECPECGKKFDVMESEFLDNGNPICPECAIKISEKEGE